MINAASLQLLLTLTQATTTVDVVVTTRDQQPLTGLSVADFRVTENKQPRKLLTATPLRPLPPETIVTRDPDLYTNRGPEIQGSSLTIVLDGLNTSPGLLERARLDLAGVLERTEFAGRIGLLYFDGALFRLGPFSNRPAEQAAALRKFRPPADGDARRRALVTQSVNMFLANPDTRDTPIYRVTAAALDTVAQGLAAVEGRKSLLWVGSSFPFAASANRGIVKGEPDGRAIAQGLATAQRTNLAIYPVALSNLPPFPQIMWPSGTLREQVRRQNSGLNFMFSAMSELRSAQLEELRDATGGRILDIDDLPAALQTAARDARSVYRLVFETPPAKANEFRSLKIELPGRSDARLLHRSATPYLVPRAENLQQVFEHLAASPLEATAVSLQVRRQGDALLITAGPEGLLTQDHRLAFDAAIALLDEKGSVSSWVGDHFEVALTGPLPAAFARQGLQWTAPVPPAARYRVIVRDQRTGLAGSVTVPAAPRP